jgi:hypothetical protein
LLVADATVLVRLSGDELREFRLPI